jgi:hypothetical protein
LLSIANVAAYPRASCLLHLDLPTLAKQWVDVGFGEDLASGVGIHADERFLYHVYIANSDFSTNLTIFDRATLEVRHVQRLDDVDDGHSLCRVGGELMVVSSGTDQVLAYPIDGVTLGTPREVWSPTNSATDTHHLNSLTYFDGQLFCSAFGPREEESWSTARHGYVRNITSGVTVLEGLRQPHSAVWHEGSLFLCNSLEGSVNIGNDAFAYLSGYSRGLAFGTDGTLYAGTSLARRPPAATDDTAVFRNPVEEGDLHGQCAVISMTPRGTNRIEIPIPPFGNEIYDILAL